MTEDLSEHMRAVLIEAGWDSSDVDKAEDIAYARRTKEAKQENIPPTAAASETGAVIGTTVGGEDVASITAELKSLQGKVASHEVMAKRKELRKRLEKAEGDVMVTFDRN